jgi:predicted RNase H-like HicB family nuclease
MISAVNRLEVVARKSPLGFPERPFQAHQKAVRFTTLMMFRVEIEQEEDGRWIAEVIDLPGVLAYGNTPEEAKARVQALALRVVADRLEHGEAGPDLVTVSFAAA